VENIVKISGNDAQSEAGDAPMRAVFLVRSFNDFDHYAPLAHHFSTVCGVRVTMLTVVADLDLQTSPVYRFLEALPNVEIAPLHRYIRKGGFLTRLKVATVRIAKSLSLPVAIRAKLGGVATAAARRDRAWLADFFDRLPPTWLFFDWTPSNKSVYPLLIEAARSRGIPSFCLPHSSMTRTSEVEGPQVPFDYDRIFLSGKGNGPFFLQRGADPARLRDIGCMRFSREWMDIYEYQVLGLPKLAERVDDDSDRDLRVVFFMRKPRNDPEFSELLTKAIVSVAGQSGIELIVRGHTRKRALPVELEAFDMRVDIDTPSAELLQWCDVCIDYGSSIAFHAHARDITHIYLRYLVGYPSEFEEQNACWCIDDTVQLKAAIEELKADRNRRPYSREDNRRLLERNIYGGDYDRNVIEDYANYFLRHTTLSALDDELNVDSTSGVNPPARLEH